MSEPVAQTHASENARTAPVANPRDADINVILRLIRLDDRGDLAVYVWGDAYEDALEEAEDFGRNEGWECDDEDTLAFDVPAGSADFAHVFFRSTLLAE